MQVVSPCNLTKCKFYIENEWSRNCLLEYLDQQNSEALASEEIAFLHQTTTEQVERVIEQAMLQLRENSEETIGIEGDFRRKKPRQFKLALDDADDIEITSSALSPSFLGSTNEVLAIGASDEAVFEHQAVRILGVLDTIINELE
jgi:hypothetical protein